MTESQKSQQTISPEELEQLNGELLPDREEMSITIGSSRAFGPSPMWCPIAD